MGNQLIGKNNAYLPLDPDGIHPEDLEIRDDNHDMVPPQKHMQQEDLQEMFDDLQVIEAALLEEETNKQDEEF